MKLKMAYDDHSKASLETGLECRDKSRTVQSEAKDADINEIVRRFGLTGELPIVQRTPITGIDFDSVMDYKDCLDAVMAADRAFNSQPAHIRARFENDPAKFLDFFNDDANRDEAIKLGVIPAPPTPEAGGSPAS